MSNYQSRNSNRPHSLPKSPGGFSSELLFGLTGGAYRAPERHHGAAGRTFEETYPRNEFSELVRLSLLLAGWLGRRRRAGRAQDLEPGDVAARKGPAPRWHGSVAAAER